MQPRRDRPRAAIVPRPAAADGADRPDRGPHVLQRFDVHHARIDHRRAGIARPAGVASGRRARQGIRFHARWSRRSAAWPWGRHFSARSVPGCTTGSQASHVDCLSIAVPTLDEALDWCWRNSEPGDAIILSPGCSSHDQFRNFRERGERFAELVNWCSRDLACPLLTRFRDSGYN